MTKDYGVYRKLSRDLKATKNLTKARESNTSLDLFVRMLPPPAPVDAGAQ